MKNIIFLLTILVVSNVFAQQSYPHKRPELMLGKQVKVLPIDEKVKLIWPGYENFYSDAKVLDRYKTIPGRIETKSEALEGRIFTITNIKKRNGYGSSAEKDYEYIYTLEDVNTKEVLYYKFLPGYDRSRLYYLEVIGGLDLPADFYCDYIDTMVISPELVINTITIPSNGEMKKSVKNGKAEYVFVMRRKDRNFQGKGYTITLENGYVIKDRFMLPPKQLDNGSWLGVHVLNDNDIEMFSKHKIKNFVLGNHTESYIIEEEKMLLKEAFNCLLTK